MNRNRTPFGTVLAILMSILLFATWLNQMPVEAGQVEYVPQSGLVGKPLQQSCTDLNLRIQSLSVVPDPPGQDLPFDIHVVIENVGSQGVVTDTWAYLYVDKAPNLSVPPDVQAFSATSVLTPAGTTVETIFTVPASFATPGYHSIAVIIDALQQVDPGCAADNTSAFQIYVDPIVVPTATSTNTPTATPFPKPQIYFFTADPTTVVLGQATTLHWQVYGEAVTVYLDGQPVSLEQTVDTYPEQTHVYTLRAENPGGFVEKTVSITILVPTSTSTPTATTCPLAVIHDFGATRTTINRGESTTLYWDLSGATEAYLNGSGVEGVSQREFTLYQTTVFVLVAHNACGDAQKSLTITVRFATPTNTYTPTPTRTPTWTPTNTPPPTSTPTRAVLTPTPTNPPQQNTITPYPTITPTSETGAQESPLATPTFVDDPTWTPTPTPTPVPTSTFTPTPVLTSTPVPSNVTPTPTWSSPIDPPLLPTATDVVTTALTVPAMVGAATATPTIVPASTPTPAPTGGTIRAYICPLSVLLLFAVGIIVVSIVLPRLREKRAPQPAYTPGYEGAAFIPDDSLLGETSSVGQGVYLVEDDIIDAEPDGPVFKVPPMPPKPPPGDAVPVDEPAD